MKKILISGKEYPCRLTMGAMVRFKNESGKDVSQLTQNDISELILFLYCCAQSACAADGIPFEMSFELFADKLEPSDLNAFYTSMSEGVQKKRTGKI